ncbi:MAG: V-type ATPase subunit [Deltaproteobacteria bacterium]|nr:V-type ATPase subunit [Deltaproteobacteria bacterium]
MKPTWDDVDARARGLGTHLLGRSRLEPLAQAADLPALAAALERDGFDTAGAGDSPAALDLAVRRSAAARMRTLARWCGRRAETLAVVFEDEDRRSLRAILRGALQGAAPQARLAGCIPTPSLSERLLEELAGAPAPSAVAALLVAWENPYGSALLEEASQQHPDPFRLESSLNRTFARRSLAGAGKAGRALREYVQEVIDLENAWSALLLAAQGGDGSPGECFLSGGRRLDRKRFETIAAGKSPAAALLCAAFVRTAFAEAFRSAGLSTLENAILTAQIREQARAMLRDPVGPAPILLYTLRLRAETVDLRRIIWGIALGAPATGLALGLVTA